MGPPLFGDDAEREQLVAMARYDRIISKIYHSIDQLIGWMLIALVCNVLLIILSRQVGMSVAWAYDLARWLVIWIAFLGSVGLTGQGSHLTIDFVFVKLPRRVQLFGTILSSLCTILFAGLVVYYGGWEVHRMYVSDERSMSGVLPAAVGYSILPIGFGLIAIAGVHFLVRSVRSRKGNGTGTL